MRRRLCRSEPLEAHCTPTELETEYQRLMRSVDFDDLGEANYHLLDDSSDGDRKTFMLNPMSKVVEYENTQYDTLPRPGIPGLWSGSESWIGR